MPGVAKGPHNMVARPIYRPDVDWPDTAETRHRFAHYGLEGCKQILRFVDNRRQFRLAAPDAQRIEGHRRIPSR